MPKPLLPPTIGKTPPSEGKNVVVCYANIDGKKTDCTIVAPAGVSSYKVRPFGEDGSDPVLVTLTNGTADNPGDAYIKFKRANKKIGYVKMITDKTLVDWDGNESKWYCPGIGSQDEGVYLLSNWQDVNK